MKPDSATTIVYRGGPRPESEAEILARLRREFSSAGRKSKVGVVHMCAGVRCGTNLAQAIRNHLRSAGPRTLAQLVAAFPQVKRSTLSSTLSMAKRAGLLRHQGRLWMAGEETTKDTNDTKG